MSESRETELLERLKRKDGELALALEKLQNALLENKLLRRKLDALARRMFGVKSEKLSKEQMQLLLQELDAPGPAEGKGSGPQPPEAELPRPQKASSAARERRPRLPEHLTLIEEVIIPEPVKLAPDAWRCIGEEVSEQLDYEPARFLRRRIVRRKYVSRQDVDAAPLIAPLPESLRERCIAAPGLLAQILVAKYCDHLPFYRQAFIYESRHDVKILRQNMTRWAGMAADWLRPIYEMVRTGVLGGGYVQVDETPIKYLCPGHGKTKQGYFWAYSRPGGDVLFDWQSSRAAACLDAVIAVDFRGTLQCDGYGAYQTFGRERGEKIRLAGCWAHARRKFFEAGQESPQVTRWILRQIQHLYRVESELRKIKAGPALRAARRAAESRMVQDRIHKALLRLKRTRRYLPQSGLGQAIDYTLNLWLMLCVWLEDGRVEIDNNLVENAIRPTAIGKKNWLFIGEEDAGDRGAILYTLVESCRRRGIDPYAYLRDVLTRLPTSTNWQIKDLTPEAWAKAHRADSLKSAA
jgi:transposase